jgi:hypothetical protein
MTPVSESKRILVAVVLILGFSAVPALASPMFYYDIRMPDGIGHAATVDDLNPAVALNLYVFVRSASPPTGNGNPDDDRWIYSTGNLMSSDSSVDPLHKLLGNLSSLGTVWAAGVVRPDNLGTNGKSIDNDTDFDVGYKATGDHWVTAYTGPVTSPSMVLMPVLGQETIGGENYLKFLIVSNIEFTFTGTTEPDDSTVVQYVPRPADGSQKGYIDNVYKTLNGGNTADVGVGEGVTITYLPEPATLALLAVGGAALVARRKKN